MRLELTLVSSINDLWLFRLVYVGVVVPLSWSVFIYIYGSMCVGHCVLWVAGGIIFSSIRMSRRSSFVYLA